MAFIAGRPPVAGIGPQFASLEYTSNGILVHYVEAVKRRRKNPSPLGGLDMSYFASLFEIIASQTGGDEEWQDEKKKQKLENIRNILKQSKAPTEDKFTEDWVSEEKTVFCTKIEEVPAAIQKAYEAYLGILSIQREGDTVYPGGPGIAVGYM